MWIRVLERELSPHQTVPSYIDGNKNTAGYKDSIAYMTGIEIYLRKNDPPLHIPKLTITNVFTGLIKHGNGKLIIDELRITRFGGDAINIHGSNISIGRLIINDDRPTRPYCPVFLPIGTNPGNLLKNITVALKEARQEVYDVSLVAWLEVYNRHKKQAYHVIPSHHVDAGIQAFNVSCNRNAATIIDLDTVSEVMLDISQANGFEREKFEDVLIAVLNSLHKLPHKLLVDPVSKQVKEIELYQEENILELRRDNGFIATTSYYSIEKRQFIERFVDSPIRENASCKVGYIDIPDVHIHTKHRNTQVFMFSEENQYSHINVGTKNLRIHCAYKHWFVANTLEKSSIGNLDGIMAISCENKKVDSHAKPGCGNNAVCEDVPLIRIGDGIEDSQFCIKPSRHRTMDVVLYRLSGIPHSLPPSGVVLKETL